MGRKGRDRIETMRKKIKEWNIGSKEQGGNRVEDSEEEIGDYLGRRQS